MHYLYHDSWKRQDQQRKKKNSSVVANSLLSQYLLIVLFTVLKYHWLFKPRKTRRLLTDRRCSDLLRFADLEARQSGNSGGMRESRSLHFFNWPPHTVSCSRGSLPIYLVLLSHPFSLLHFLLIWRLYDVLRTLCVWVEVHKVGRAVALSLRTITVTYSIDLLVVVPQKTKINQKSALYPLSHENHIQLNQ